MPGGFLSGGVLSRSGPDRSSAKGRFSDPITATDPAPAASSKASQAGRLIAAARFHPAPRRGWAGGEVREGRALHAPGEGGLARRTEGSPTVGGGQDVWAVWTPTGGPSLPVWGSRGTGTVGVSGRCRQGPLHRAELGTRAAGRAYVLIWYGRFSRRSRTRKARAARVESRK